MRLRIDPAWRRAPRGLLRHPAAVAALTLASAAVVAVLVSQPLYVGAVSTAVLTAEVEQRAPLHGGLLVATNGPLSRGAVEPLAAALSTALATVDAADPETTLTGSTGLQVRHGATARPARLLSRTGALEQLPVARRLGAEGIWLSEQDGRILRPAPGDRVTLQLGDASVEVPVAGFYSDLLAGDTAAYWQRLPSDTLPRDGFTPRAPPLVVADPETMLDLATQLGDSGRVWWQQPLTPETLVLSAAHRTADAYDAAARDAFVAGTALGDAFAPYEPPQFESGIRDALANVNDSVAVMQPPVRAIAISAGVATLGLVAVAVTLVLAQRRRELRLHAVRGTGVPAYGAYSALAAAPIVLVGGALGGAVITLLVGRLGPGGGIGPDDLRSALLRAALGLVTCLVVVSLVSALALWREAAGTRGPLDGARRWAWWEPVVLTLAVTGWLRTRDAVASGTTPVDLVTLALPVLLLVALLGLCGRLAAFGLTRLRRNALARLTPVRFALRRLAAPRSAAPVLLISTGVAAGLLVYAVTAYTSNTAALDAKTTASVGAESIAHLPPEAEIEPGDLPADMALVLRSTASVAPGNVPVTIYGVDPVTFGQVTDWHPWFSDVPSQQLLDGLGGGDGPLPAIAAGSNADGEQVPDQGVARSVWHPTDLQVVARTRALPRMPRGRGATVLVDQSRLIALIAAQTNPVTGEAPEVGDAVFRQIWSQRSRPEMVAWLDARGIEASDVETRSDLLADGRVLAQGWSLNYLRILGVLAAVMMFAAGVLVLQQRQQERFLSYGFARQMGLRPRTHRAALFAEIAAIFLVATVIGAAVGVGGAGIVVTRFDPLPRIIPQPQLVVPLGWMAVIAVAATMLSLLTSWWLHVRSERADLPGVLRAHG